jgi:hypothetical protein
MRAFVFTHPDGEYRYANTPHGKGLGGGASVRTLPGAGKEVLFEHVVRVLAPAANGFVRIAPETPALDFSFVTFLCIKTKEK